MVDRILDKASKENEIHKIDLEINKLAFFVQRNLSGKFSNNSKNFLLYEEAATLESLGDFLRSFKIYSSLNENDKEFLNKFYEIIDSLKAEISTFEHFLEIKKKINALQTLVEKLKKKDKNNSILASILLLKNLKQLFEVKFTLNIQKLNLVSKDNRFEKDL